jgi:hypothetical protein
LAPALLRSPRTSTQSPERQSAPGAREVEIPPYQVVRETSGSNDAEAQERYLRAKLDCENLMLVSSWVEHGTGDRPRLRNKLRARLANEQGPLPYNCLHDLLARMAQQKPMAIITTNYDDLAELALVERSVPFDLFVVAIHRPASEARVQGVTLFRPAGQDDLKPVTGEQELLMSRSTLEKSASDARSYSKFMGISAARRTDDTFVITEEDYVSFLGRMGSGTR